MSELKFIEHLLPKPPEPPTSPGAPPCEPAAAEEARVPTFIELAAALEPPRRKRVGSFQLFGIPPREIYVDTLARTEHYTDAQKALARELVQPTAGTPEPKDRELIDLVSTYMRPSAARIATEIALAKAVDPRKAPKGGDGPDGPPASGKPSGKGPAHRAGPTFEEQNYGPTIKII